MFDLRDSSYLSQILSPEDLTILRASDPAYLDVIPATPRASAVNLQGGYNFTKPQPAFSAGRPDLIYSVEGPSSSRAAATGKIGGAAGDVLLELAAMAGTASGKYNNAVRALYQNPVLATASKGIKRGAGKLAGKAGMRLAGSALKVAPAIGAVGGVLGVGDVVFGNDSLANKAMDTTAMTIGGILGSVGGPLGTAAGMGIGKTASDATQWLFGDKKTAEQRKMEEALAALRGGVI